MTPLAKKALLLAAANVLASVPPWPVENIDRPKPAPDTKKRAKVKAARKQKKGTP
jgi:hypothetical protein